MSLSIKANLKSQDIEDKKTIGQLELPIVRQREPDRNFDKGGRSFYFFDFDDNVAFLSSQIFLFHKKTGEELALSTAEYAQHSKIVGSKGLYKDFEVRYNDETGSFRRFRDYSPDLMKKYLSSNQPFIDDLAHALMGEDLHWKGPSWSCFYHATFNQRPVSVITARGHHPETITSGIDLFVHHGHIPQRPNYLAIFPVSHSETRRSLGDPEYKLSVARLKQIAIRKSVEKAFEVYGENPHHRFGMSDDDPHNVELILEEMIRLKKDYPEVSFFVIETHGNKQVKKEVFIDHISQTEEAPSQLSFFT